MLLGVYRALTAASVPIVRLYLRHRWRRGKEDRARFAERRGVASLPRPAGSLVWIHAASVGESLSILSLIGRIAGEWPSLNLLITTGTVTSARLLEARLPPGVIHQFVPVDRAAWVRRFLDHWRPDLALWVESELWPNALDELARRHVPAVLVNGRMSDRSFQRWRRFPASARRVLAAFDLCLAQSAADGKRFAELGTGRVASPGNLKFAAAPLPCEAGALEAFRATVGDRPLWLAASTHEGEEILVGDAHRILRRTFPGLLTVIVPRHATRGEALAAALADGGLKVARRAAGADIAPGTDIYLADTMGELGLFYRAAPVALIGGSLVPHGGQNPLEAAQLDTALLFGPNMTNFREISASLAAAAAAVTVADAGALAEEVARLLSDSNACAARARAAASVAGEKSGILDGVLRELKPYFDQIDESHLEAKLHARA